MSLGEQIAFWYGVLSVLATAFLLLMTYWQYKKPIKFRRNAPIYGTGMQGTDAYIQCLDGSSIGPFTNFAEAEKYLQKYGK